MEMGHMKVLIVYYSMYGHVHLMAETVAKGASVVEGTEVAMRRVPETLPEEVLEKIGAVEAQETFAHIAICTLDELAFTDAIIFGTPMRFGKMCGQMRQFLDATGGLWKEESKVSGEIYRNDRIKACRTSERDN